MKFRTTPTSKPVSIHGNIEGKLSPTVRRRILAALAHLPPGDPLTVGGTQPVVNVVETDGDYTMGQNDFAVLCQGASAISVTTTASPLAVTPILVIADTGTTVTVHGPIAGGSFMVPAGTFAFLSFSPLSGLFNKLTSTSATGPTGAGATGPTGAAGTPGTAGSTGPTGGTTNNFPNGLTASNSVPAGQALIAASHATGFAVTLGNTSNTIGGSGVLIVGGQNGGPSGSAFLEYQTPDGTVCGDVRQNGANGVTYVNSSDARLKESIGPIANALASVMKLRPRRFSWKSDEARQIHNGFFAQEFREIFPDAVHAGGEDPHLKPWMMEAGHFSVIATLTAALQELATKVESLEAGARRKP